VIPPPTIAITDRFYLAGIGDPGSGIGIAVRLRGSAASARQPSPERKQGWLATGNQETFNNWKREAESWKLQPELMHMPRQLLHQLERSVGQNAVTQIEDMPRTPAGTP
jgi:hypothetical protein